MSSQTAVVAPAGVGTGPQYAVKKRRRPQPRSKNDEKAQQKSNPSKRHRDRLNAELERLSSLIPFPPEVINKLDKLSILRLAVAYMRNKNYQAAVSGSTSSKSALPKDFFNDLPSIAEIGVKSLDGFIIVITQDFNVFYVTSTVQDYLGYPQSDIVNQSMIDYIHTDDRQRFMQQMQVNNNETTDVKAIEDGSNSVPSYTQSGYTPEVFNALSEDGLLNRSFICRLRCLLDTSSGFLALHFTGHLKSIPGQVQRTENGKLLAPEVGLFLLATPLQTPSILEIRTKNFIFQTRHKLDYQPLGIDANGQIVLGYTEYELCQQSGYQFVHSADMMHCADAHTKLMKTGESGLSIFRLLHRAKRWQWVTATARLSYSKGKPEHIIVTHRAITDQEGEEHLTTRISAFKFDFTGQAILYDDNAGPPPPPPPQDVGKPPPVASEKPDFDPATLHGAKMLQAPDIYEPPPRKIHDFMHSEFLNPEISIVKCESSNLPSDDQEISLTDLFFNTPSQPIDDCSIEDLLLQSSDYSPMSSDSGIQGSGSYKSYGDSEPPRLHHSPLYGSSGCSSDSNSPGNGSIHATMVNKNQYVSTNPLTHNGHPEPYGNGQPYVDNSYQQHGYIPNGNDSQNVRLNNQHHIPSKTMYQQPAASKHNSYQQQQPQQAMHNEHTHSASSSINPYAGTRQDEMGIINSLDITSSVQSASAQEQKQFLKSKGVEEITPAQQDALNIEFQENLIHVNLDNIAAHYQTSNPMQVLQDYMSNNPKAALSITQGFVPEAGLNDEYDKQQMPNEQQFPHNNQYYQEFVDQQYNSMAQNNHIQQQHPPHQMMNNMNQQPHFQDNMEQHPGKLHQNHPGKLQQQHPGSFQQQHPGKLQQQHPGKLQQPHPGKLQQHINQQQLPGKLQNQQQHIHNQQQYQNWGS